LNQNLPDSGIPPRFKPKTARSRAGSRGAPSTVSPAEPEAAAQHGADNLLNEVERLGWSGMPILLSTGIHDDAVERVLASIAPAAISSLADYAKLRDPSKYHLTVWFMGVDHPDCVKLMKLH
jgi:hypothetical protein